jgi:hypothetical protein
VQNHRNVNTLTRGRDAVEGRSRSISSGLSAELFRMDVLSDFISRLRRQTNAAATRWRGAFAGQRWRDGEAEIGKTDETLPR